MEAHTVEFPAGEIGQGEHPLEAARREVAEEIGVDSILLSLGNYSLMMNRTNIRNYLFLGLSSGLPVQKKQEEGIKRLEVTKQKFKKMVMKGEYLQLAGLGLLQIVRLKYGVDLLRDPLKKILSIFE
jgi:ADP-ribose pyrophosphatase YjhB (NUDIX family)